MQKITPFLWFDKNAEQAVRFYTSIFKTSKILKVVRYTKASREIHGRKPGAVMTIAFKLAGQNFVALNGGPSFKFTEAVSMVVNCDTQREVDYYWDRLSKGGPKQAQICGWLKDKYGLSWQIVPAALPKLLGDRNTAKAQRAMQAMMQMKKLDIAKLKQAFEGR